MTADICDVGVMTAIPNIAVVVPSDATQTRLAVRAMLAHPGPVYLRLGRESSDPRARGDQRRTDRGIGAAGGSPEKAGLSRPVKGTL